MGRVRAASTCLVCGVEVGIWGWMSKVQVLGALNEGFTVVQVLGALKVQILGALNEGFTVVDARECALQVGEALQVRGQLLDLHFIWKYI